MSNSLEQATCEGHSRQISVPLLLALLSSCLGLCSCTSLGGGTQHTVQDQPQAPPPPAISSTGHDEFKYCPIETVRQPSDNAAGIAALTAVMQYWDLEVEVDELAEKYPPSDAGEGYSLLQLRRIATKEDMMAFALTMKDRPLDQISEQLENGRPVLVPVLLPSGGYLSRETSSESAADDSRRHYVVIFGQSGQKFLLMDPARGIVKVNKADLLNYWSAEKNAALLCSSF